jgi:hypothetical protein
MDRLTAPIRSALSPTDRHRRRPRLGTVVLLVALLGTTGALAESGLAMDSGYGPVLARSTVDRSDDVLRKSQVHVMYLLPSNGPDRALDTDGTLRNTVSSFQTWLAGKTKGKQALRIDTFNGSLDVTFFRLSRTDEEIASFGPFVRDLIEAELVAAGFTAENKLYAVYYDGTSTFACGAGAWPPTIPGNVAALYLLGLPQAPVPCSSQVFAALVVRRPISSSQCCTRSFTPSASSRLALPTSGEQGMSRTIRTILCGQATVLGSRADGRMSFSIPATTTTTARTSTAASISHAAHFSHDSEALPASTRT